MKAFGRHLLVEYRGCDRDLLDDSEQVETHLRRAAIEAGATIVAAVFHRFSPQGVTGVVVVEESHLSIHTWPEHGYAAVDFFTCGDCLPERAHEYLFGKLKARSSEIMKVDRGIDGMGESMAVRSHTVDDHSPSPDKPTRGDLPGIVEARDNPVTPRRAANKGR